MDRSFNGQYCIPKTVVFPNSQLAMFFAQKNRLLAIRNTRFEKQSSIYSRQMRNLNSFAWSVPGSDQKLTNFGDRRYRRTWYASDSITA